MTDLIRRADAIEAVLTYFIPRSHTGERGEHEEDFVRTIFKALPSAEAPKGDLISRQWLLEVYGDYIGDNGESKYNVPLEVVRQSIKDAPSAEAVPSEQYKKGFEDAKRAFELEFAREAESIRKRNAQLEVMLNAQKALSADAVQGEWQKVEEQPYFRKHYDTVCCSVCRKKGNRKWNFCPSCGAIMKGGAE